MSDKSQVFKRLQIILSQLKADLEAKGLKLENLSEEEVARLIKQYVPEDIVTSSIQILSQNKEYSVTPLLVTLPKNQDHSELLSALEIAPNNKGKIIQTLPMVAYFLGRMFTYDEPDGLGHGTSTNDLYLSSMLDEPIFNLVGIYRIEKILNELSLGNFTVTLNGAIGAIFSPTEEEELFNPISFTADVCVRLNHLIDGHRVFIKSIAISKAYNYEILDGEYVFFNDNSSTNDFNLSISGISELEYIIVEENTEVGSLDVLNIEQFTMTGVLGQCNQEVSLRKLENQAKIAHTFIRNVENAVIEQHSHSALELLTEFAKKCQIKKSDHNKPKSFTANSPIFYDLENFNGLPS